jgi:hydroxymethylpyrimidine/phosphomethylpyrimidine kinase
VAKAGVKAPPCILTLAGSDSGGGAGLQADARTIQALGGYAVTAVTAVTAQNGAGLTAWKAVAPGLITAQIRAVAAGFDLAALKTGLLPGAAAVRAVVAEVRRHPRLPLVVDPVLGSTSGTRFLPAPALRELRESLLPLATLVTPNWPEAAELGGHPVRTSAEAAEAGLRLAERFGCAVLVKGGHGPGRLCRDWLVLRTGALRAFEGPRIATGNTHGTGCVLSAAIATGLAHGLDLEAAVMGARRFLQRQLTAGRRVRWRLGAGPAFPG